MPSPGEADHAKGGDGARVRRCGKAIAQQFREGTIKLDREALTIHDVGGVKIVADAGRLARLEKALTGNPKVSVVEKTIFSGNYQAASVIVEVPGRRACLPAVRESAGGEITSIVVSGAELRRGLEPFLRGAAESQAGAHLFPLPRHGGVRAGEQSPRGSESSPRETTRSTRATPMNVEFLIEYLFAVGMSPQVSIDRLPIKLWGATSPTPSSTRSGRSFASRLQPAVLALRKPAFIMSTMEIGRRLTRMNADT